jgi:ATP-binding cassette subfamily B protein
VQLFNRESVAMEQFDQINADHRQVNIESIFYYAVFFPAVELISAIGMGLVVWYGGGQVLQHEMTIGALIGFFQLSQRFFRPISDLSEKYNILQSAMASSERIFRLLDTPVNITSPANEFQPRQVRGHIEFRHVWFAYQDEEWVLRDVSFEAKPGERIAIVGHTGAGKTTITNLLLRFYDIQQGQILLDGVDIREWDLKELRRAFAIVLQDVFLFTGDIESNIRLGEENLDGDRVERAAREVHAHEFIQQLPGGYKAPVKERGATLSTGQKQLIAFARALAFDPAVLILDEATANIDTQTELLIRDALDRLLRGRTSLVIAHRLSTIQNADRILVLHKGRLREVGTHDELLKLRGIYYRLYQLQYKDQEIPMVGD